MSEITMFETEVTEEQAVVMLEALDVLELSDPRPYITDLVREVRLDLLGALREMAASRLQQKAHEAEVAKN